MKKYLFLAALIVAHPALAETDQEKLEHCKVKFKQVAVDTALEDQGCKYSPETQKAINQNMVKTIAKCQSVLKTEERAAITKTALNKAEAMIKTYGLKTSCEANGNLYPAQLNQ